MNLILYFGIILNLITVYNLKPITSKTGNNRSEEDRYHYDIETINERKNDYSIHPMILSRRSLKEMSSEEISDKELMPLFEAARWAPSSYNTQEWRFVYTKRNSDQFNNFLDLMKPKNQLWAQKASVLLVLVSNMYNTYKGQRFFRRTHSFDCGNAFMAMALEGTARGYVVHPIAGFDTARAASVIGIEGKSDYNIEIMIAIGKRLPQSQRTFNEIMSQRISVDQFISENVFVEKE